MEIRLSKLTGLMRFMLCCMCFTLTNAYIFVCETKAKQIIEEYNDLPAQFGGVIPSTKLKVFLYDTNSHPLGCDRIPPAERINYPPNARFAVLIKRGHCTFEEKVRNAQAANYSVAIIYNNRSDDLEHMSAKNASGIVIPSVFVAESTGRHLQNFFTNDTFLIIDDELPFNINTQLILPFCILLGICFVIMILYMIYKCVRAERRLRRHRLPKRLLKKLPIRKYTKNSDLPYDTCVICLDEFSEGDKLRILPCKHAYHSKCIDPWLTKSKSECPICKRKLFTKRETRSQRIRRQSPLDSVTDTEDDTTPLMQQSSSSLNRNPAGSTTSTTRHGTFRRAARGNSTDLGQQFSSTGSDGGGQASESTDNEMMTSAPLRVNPFDRHPNLPAHLDAQLNAEATNRRSIRSWSITNFFRRLLRFSETEPPYQDILNDVVTEVAAATNDPLRRASSRSQDNHDCYDDDEDDEPMLSIYEPANTHRTPIINAQPLQSHPLNAVANLLNVNNEDDEAFYHTPPSTGILVAALPRSDNSTQGRQQHRRGHLQSGYFA